MKRANRDESGLTRREFLSIAGGLVVLVALREAAPAIAGAPEDRPALPDQLTAWLRISPEGRVTIFAPTPEVGQGIRTCLAQLAAEELSVPVSSVEVVLGDTDRVPPDSGLCASDSVPTIGPYIRQAAAQARQIVCDLAAASWGVSQDDVILRDGQAVLVSDPSKSSPIGDLVRGKDLSHALQPPPELKPSADWTVIGQSVRRLDGPGYIRGRARYAADVRLPGLVYARVVRPPVVGASLVKADVRAAASQPGVIGVVQGGDFVGVVATRQDIADRACLSVQATWEQPNRASMSTLYQDLRASAKPQAKLGLQGDVEVALAGARHGYSASYRLPFSAHAPMEPHCAVADPRDDRMVIYASTQRPFLHRNAVAKALGLSPGRVRVIVSAVGGAFGGKDAPDVSVQAARLAQAVRRPVMLSQTRREEMTTNYFRPAAIVDIRAGVNAGGQIVAWDCDVFNGGPRGAVPPYEFAARRIRLYNCTPPLPQGPARALGAPAVTFAREVHLDHIAVAEGLDPVALRLNHLAGNARFQNALRVVSERYGWDTRRPPTGQGIGFALAVDAGACAAVIAAVDVDRSTGQVRVRRVWVAQDSGLVINPDNTRNQIEGGVVMGLGLALKEFVRYELGRVLSQTFASYPIPTFRDAPDVEIVLMPNPDLPPQGDTTAAFCAIAPAVANAVFDATGKRLRDLPLAPGAIRAG